MMVHADLVPIMKLDQLCFINAFNAHDRFSEGDLEESFSILNVGEQDIDLHGDSYSVRGWFLFDTIHLHSQVCAIGCYVEAT